MALIGNPSWGLCGDIWCENPDEPDILTPVAYIDSNKGPALLCQDCLETWNDVLDDYLANRSDFDLGGYPFLPQDPWQLKEVQPWN